MTALEALKNACDRSWYVQTIGDEWQHHYSSGTHQHPDSIDKAFLENMVETSSFIKLSSFLPLKRWNDAEGIFSGKFAELVNAIKAQLPNL